MATKKRSRRSTEGKGKDEAQKDDANNISNLKSTHIRFEDGVEVRGTNQNAPSVAVKKAKAKSSGKKRGRDTSSLSTSSSLSSLNSSHAISGKPTKPLNGLLLSVSTLADASSDSRSNAFSETATFRSVADMCENLGARVSPQVHARVSAVVVTALAVERATQRIRKALRKSIPVVEVEWLNQCRQEQRRLEWTPFLCTQKAQEAAELLEQRRLESAVATLSPREVLTETEPISLDCCCLCHDEDSPLLEDECQWCTSCNVNLARWKALASSGEQNDHVEPAMKKRRHQVQT